MFLKDLFLVAHKTDLGDYANNDIICKAYSGVDEVIKILPADIFVIITLSLSK